MMGFIYRDLKPENILLHHSGFKYNGKKSIKGGKISNYNYRAYYVDRF